MGFFIARRVLSCVLIIWAMSVLVFLAVYALPGNVAYAILGQYAPPADVADLEQRLGLNDPLVVQYGRWLAGVLTGNLGDSLAITRRVAPLVLGSRARRAVLTLV